MLTSAQLERATQGYRRGYNDAAMERPYEESAGIWAAKDYRDGYAAALNDKRWNERPEAAR